MTTASSTELVPLDDATWGPAMLALSDQQRRFVLACFMIPEKHGRHAKAARMAGYGTATTTPAGWAAIGYRVGHSEKVQDAIREEQERRVVALAPGALFALEKLIANPKHRDHGRAVAMVLDRVSPVTTIHEVKKEHRHVIVDKDKVLAEIAAIARRVGLDPKQMAAPVTIEAEAVEVTEGNTDARD